MARAVPLRPMPSRGFAAPHRTHTGRTGIKIIGAMGNHAGRRPSVGLDRGTASLWADLTLLSNLFSFSGPGGAAACSRGWSPPKADGTRVIFVKKVGAKDTSVYASRRAGEAFCLSRQVATRKRRKAAPGCRDRSEICETGYLPTPAAWYGTPRARHSQRDQSVWLLIQRRMIHGTDQRSHFGSEAWSNSGP